MLRPRRWSYAFVAFLYPFYIISEVQLNNVQLNANDTRTQVDMLQLVIMNHKFIMLDDQRSRQDGGLGPKDPGPVHDYPQTDGYDKLIRSRKTEDSSSLFHYMRMEPLRFGLESKRATPTLGEYLNQAWSWPERKEWCGSVAEAPRLTMP